VGTKRSDLYFYTAKTPTVTEPFLPSVNYCTCNLAANTTTGVPDGFIKEGMSTFYVQASSSPLIQINHFFSDCLLAGRGFCFRCYPNEILVLGAAGGDRGPEHD
jgi:hypothetical protein